MISSLPRKALRMLVDIARHAFSKPSLVNLISKDANLVFYLSVYPLLNTLQTSDNDVFFLLLCRFSVISKVIQKVQRHHDLIKVHAVR